MGALEGLLSDRGRHGKVLCHVADGLIAYVVVEYDGTVRIEEWALKSVGSASKYIMVDYVELSKKALKELTVALMEALGLK